MYIKLTKQTSDRQKTRIMKLKLLYYVLRILPTSYLAYDNINKGTVPVLNILKEPGTDNTETTLHNLNNEILILACNIAFQCTLAIVFNILVCKLSEALVLLNAVILCANFTFKPKYKPCTQKRLLP